MEAILPPKLSLWTAGASVLLKKKYCKNMDVLRAQLEGRENIIGSQRERQSVLQLLQVLQFSSFLEDVQQPF